MKRSPPPFWPSCSLPRPRGRPAIEDVRKAYDGGDFAVAFEEVRPLAEAGDVKAMTLLGLMYRKGQGTDADTDAAIDWLGRAAEKNDAEAQLALGMIYLDEEAGRFDYDKGQSFLRRAADAGLVEAQFNMGLLTAGAFGNPPEFTLAAEWFAKAAAQGHAGAHV